MKKRLGVFRVNTVFDAQVYEAIVLESYDGITESLQMGVQSQSVHQHSYHSILEQNGFIHRENKNRVIDCCVSIIQW